MWASITDPNRLPSLPSHHHSLSVTHTLTPLVNKNNIVRDDLVSYHTSCHYVKQGHFGS